MRRALVIANKWWEADPLLAVLSSARTCAPSFYFTHENRGVGFRGAFDAARRRVEVWCLQEMMGATVSGSSSEEKARVLPPLLNADDVALVIAFGTAAACERETHNGCVRIGTKVFLHDAKLGGSTSNWNIPRPDEVIASALSPGDFDSIAGASPVAAHVASLALRTPNAPSTPTLLAEYDLVALADVNVTDYLKFTKADQAVVDAYDTSNAVEPIGSIETTHGVLRECLPEGVPFMFVSGITDRLGHFDDDIGSPPYQQNFVAAHNAGLAVAAMLPAIMSFLSPA